MFKILYFLVLTMYILLNVTKPNPLDFSVLGSFIIIQSRKHGILKVTSDLALFFMHSSCKNYFYIKHTIVLKTGKVCLNLITVSLI